ncbi:MAG: hypothetical protein ACREX3_03075 [Gammaproteobacteria bacterium]
MRYFISLVMLLAAACGDSTSPPRPPPPVPAQFALVAGADQTDTVTRELKDAIALRVIASDGVTPVPSYPINWAPVDGGSVFAPVVYSGSDGIARQRWTLGTAAGTQRLVARALNPETGAVLVDHTVNATATHDVPTRYYWENKIGNWVPEPGKTWDLTPYLRDIWDTWGNPVPKEDAATTPLSWAFSQTIGGSGGTVCRSGPGIGPDGTGWNIAIPDFVDLGYRLIWEPVLRDADGDGTEERYALWSVPIDISPSSPGIAHGGSLGVLRQLAGYTPLVTNEDGHLINQPPPSWCES